MITDIDVLLRKFETDAETDIRAKVQQLLRLGCSEFGLPIGIFARIIARDYTVMQVHANESAEIRPGQKFQLENTFCALVSATRNTVGFANIDSTEWADHPAYERFGLRAYYGAPIFAGPGIFGTLNFSSPEPGREERSSWITPAVKAMAEWLTGRLALDPRAPYLCSELCRNHRRMCADPLPTCARYHAVRLVDSPVKT